MIPTIRHATANKAKPTSHSPRTTSNSPNSINQASGVRMMAKSMVFVLLTKDEAR